MRNGLIALHLYNRHNSVFNISSSYSQIIFKCRCSVNNENGIVAVGHKLEWSLILGRFIIIIICASSITTGNQVYQINILDLSYSSTIFPFVCYFQCNLYTFSVLPQPVCSFYCYYYYYIVQYLIEFLFVHQVTLTPRDFIFIAINQSHFYPRCAFVSQESVFITLIHEAEQSHFVIGKSRIQF